MKFLVITLAPTLLKDGKLHSYAPYVKEMNIWFSHVDEPIIASPTNYKKPLLLQHFQESTIEVVSLPAIEFNSFLNALRSLFLLPVALFRIFNQMNKADHIHLRCPGTIPLLGCLAQTLFPNKPKTAKYAGNWDPKSKQPLSYRFQKWILSNTFLTKNMQVLVYGSWEGMTGNIKPFFTATYPNSKVPGILKRNFEPPFKFVFVGTLSEGKQPLYAIKLIEKLIAEDVLCELAIYGDGPEAETLKHYVAQNGLEKYIFLYGNQPAEVIETAYKQSHFMLLPSKSEGWPKVVAESMFWGTIPVVTSVSCVPWMLDHGGRGILINGTIANDHLLVKIYLTNSSQLMEMSEAAQKWSHQYTLDTFEEEIIKLLK